MEPFFSVMLSWIFLGEQQSVPVLLTLLPIVGGVALASFAEASFNWLGFPLALESVLAGWFVQWGGPCGTVRWLGARL